jgi:hypothetical protein
MHMLPYAYYFHGLCYENSFDVFGHDENYLYYVISNSFLFEFFFFFFFPYYLCFRIMPNWKTCMAVHKSLWSNF